MNDRVTVDIQGGVADVRLVRADKMNALDGAMFSALIETGERLKTEPGVRAVVLSGAAPAVADRLLQGLDRVKDWRGRMAAIGHGRRSEMTGAEALQLAMRSQPAVPPASDPADLLDLRPGDAVVVRADDYGRDPVEGRLVALTRDRVVVARECGELDVLHVHFPRAGYVLSRA